MKLFRDNRALGYEDRGRGDPPLLLIHGWGVDRRVFALLGRELAKIHRVVAVDLRGHGESDAPASGFDIADHADDVAWIAAELGLVKPVIVGHSMGGFVALELAVRLGARAAVVLECHVAAPPGVAAALKPAIDRLETDAYAVTAGALLDRLLGDHFDPGERARMIADVRRLPQHVLARTLRASVEYDAEDTVSKIGCPVLYVGTSTPYADLLRVRELCPRLVTGQVVACGHYFPLEVPDQLTPMIARFLQVFVTNVSE